MTSFGIYTHAWNYHHSHQDQEFTWCLPSCDLFATPISLLLPSVLRGNHYSVSVTWISLHVLEAYLNGIIQFVFFSYCLLSLSRMFWDAFMFYCSSSSFLLLSSIPLYGYTRAVASTHFKNIFNYSIIEKV